MTALSAGRLRDRIDFLRPVRTPTGKGGFVTTPGPAYATSVAAEVAPLTASEAVQERVLRGIRVYRITTQHRADVRQSDQIQFGGELLNIRSAVDPERRRRRLVIEADTDGVPPA